MAQARANCDNAYSLIYEVSIQEGPWCMHLPVISSRYGGHLNTVNVETICLFVSTGHSALTYYTETLPNLNVIVTSEGIIGLVKV